MDRGGGDPVDPLVVRRSAWRMWTIALAGIPLLVIAIDVLTQRRITDSLRELLFPPDDTQLLEPRDVIWAWAMLAVGSVLTLWGLKELILPTTVVRADRSGLWLRLRGPFRDPVRIPWDEVDDVGSATVDDDGDQLPVMWVKVTDPERLPTDPWGARWVDERTVAMLSADWEQTATQVAKAVTETAVAAARVDRAEQDDPP